MGDRMLLVVALTVVCGLTGAFPFASGAEPPTRDLKALAFSKQPAHAKALFEARRGADQALDAKWLEAMSWVGRAGAIGEDWEIALDYSERTLEGCEALLRTEELGAGSGSLASDRAGSGD